MHLHLQETIKESSHVCKYIESSHGSSMEHLLTTPKQVLTGFDLPFWLVLSNIFYFHPYLGKWSNLTNIFEMGWNHQLALISNFPGKNPRWPAGDEAPQWCRWIMETLWSFRMARWLCAMAEHQGIGRDPGVAKKLWSLWLLFFFWCFCFGLRIAFFPLGEKKRRCGGVVFFFLRWLVVGIVFALKMMFDP